MKEISDNELRALFRESFPEPERDLAFERRVLSALPPRKSLLVQALEFVASPYFLWLVTVALCVFFRRWIMESLQILVHSLQTMTLPSTDVLSMISMSLAVFAFLLFKIYREAVES